jgi:hypothetical protein
MFAASGDGDEAPPAEEQQVAVGDLGSRGGEVDVGWVVGGHDWIAKPQAVLFRFVGESFRFVVATKKARRGTRTSDDGLF